MSLRSFLQSSETIPDLNTPKRPSRIQAFLAETALPPAQVEQPQEQGILDKLSDAYTNIVQPPEGITDFQIPTPNLPLVPSIGGSLRAPTVPLRQAVEKVLPSVPTEQTTLGAVGAKVRGMTKGIASVAEGFTTKENLAILAATWGLGAARTGLKAIDSVLRYGPAGVDATFAFLAAEHVPEQWQEFQRLQKDPNATEEQKAEAATLLAGNVGLTILGLYGTAKQTAKTYRTGKEAKRVEAEVRGIEAEEAQAASEEAARMAKEADLEAERQALASQPRQFIVDEQGQAVPTPESIAKKGVEADKAQRKRLEDLSLNSIAKQVNPKAKSFEDLSPLEKKQATKKYKEGAAERREILEAIKARSSEQTAGREELEQAAKIADEINAPLQVDAEIIPPRETPQLAAGDEVRQLPPPRRAFYGKPPAESSNLRNPAVVESEVLQRTQELESQGATSDKFETDPKLIALDQELRRIYRVNKAESAARKDAGLEIGQVGPVIAEPPAPGRREFVGRRIEPEPPVAKAPEPVKAEPVKTPEQKFVEIREQLAADYGKTFDQLTSGQKASVTRKAREIVKEEQKPATKQADIFDQPTTKQEPTVDIDDPVDFISKARSQLDNFKTYTGRELPYKALIDKIDVAYRKMLGSQYAKADMDTFFRLVESPEVQQLARVYAESKKTAVLPEYQRASKAFLNAPSISKKVINERAIQTAKKLGISKEEALKIEQGLAEKQLAEWREQHKSELGLDTRPNTQATADSKSFNSALDDFNALSKELQGKPASEAMAIAKVRLEEKGYHPAIIDELTNPDRLKRPELEGDVHDATTREGRIKRASEPTPELKVVVDTIAQKDVNYRNAKSEYDAALKEIGKEVEKLGGEIIINTDDGSFSIKFNKGKPKLSAQDAALIARLKQEAAEAGAYSLESVGKGFEIFAAPLKIADAKPLTGDFRAKLVEFIRRKNKLKTAKKEYDVTAKRSTDKLVDNYLANKAAGKPTGSLVGRADNGPVEVGVRRKASATDPDLPVVDSATGKTHKQKIADERKAALARSAERGPQGEPFVQGSPISEKTARTRAEGDKPFFDIRSHLDEAERTALDDAFNRTAEKIRRTSGRLDLGLLDAGMWKDLAETGYYVSKALGRATKGKAVEFGQWSAEMIKHFGEKIKPLLKDLWDRIPQVRKDKVIEYLDNKISVEPSLAALEFDLQPREAKAMLDSLVEEGRLETTKNRYSLVDPSESKLNAVLDKSDFNTVTPNLLKAVDSEPAGTFSADDILPRIRVDDVEVPAIPNKLKFYRGLRKAGNAEGRMASFGRWFSASKEVAKSYGENVIEVTLNVNKPFNYKAASKETLLKIADEIGADRKFVENNYGNFKLNGPSAGQILNKWVDEFGYPNVKQALQNLGYDAIYNPSGETLSSWGPSAPEISVFNESAIREIPGRGRARFSEKVSDSEKVFNNVRKYLDEAEQKALDAVFERGAKRLADAKGRIDAGVLDPVAWKDLAETGYLVSKALGRAAKGKTVEFVQWAAEMTRQFGERIKPLLKDLWNELEAGFKPGMKQVETQQFKKWFGDWEKDPKNASKVVDEQGKPKVMYHGTTRDFEAFDPYIGEFGSHFAKDPNVANSFVSFMFTGTESNRTSRVYPVYLDIKNPTRLKDTGVWSSEGIKRQLVAKKIMTEAEFKESAVNDRVGLVRILESKGYDGIVYLNRYETPGLPLGDKMSRLSRIAKDMSKATDEEFAKAIPEASDAYIIFRPEQAKSAIGNFGTFSKADPTLADVSTRKLFDIRANLDKSEVAALDQAHANLKAETQKLHGGPVSSAMLKDYATISYYTAKGLKRNLGEKVEITYDQFTEALRTNVNPNVFKGMDTKMLWEMMQKLPKDWKPGDAIPVIPTTGQREDDQKQGEIEKVARENVRLFQTTDLTTKLEVQNSVAKKIAEGFRQANDILENTKAKYEPENRKIAKMIRGPRQTQKTQNLSGYEIYENKIGADSVLKQVLNDPKHIMWEHLSKEERAIVETYQKTKAAIDAEIETLLKNEKVRELAEQGDLFPELVTWTKTKKGYQPTLNTAAREALFVDKGGPFFDTILQALLERHPKISKTQALQYIENRQLYKFNDIPTHVFFGDRMVPISAAEPLAALEAMTYEGSRLLGFMKVFGGKYKENIKGLRKAYLDQFAKEGKSAIGKGIHLDELYDAYWGLRKRGAFSKFIESDRPINSENAILRLLSPVLNPAIRGAANVALPALRSLALTASAPLQLPQPFLATSNVGFKNLAKAYKDAGRYAKTAADLEAIGAIDREILNWAVAKDAEGKRSNLSGDLGRIASGIINRADMMQGISSLNDVVAAGAYKHWTRGLIEHVEAGKKLTRAHLQTLKNLKLSEAQIKLIEQGKIKEPTGAPKTPEEELFVNIVRRGRKNEQFTGLSAIERTRFQNATGLSRILLPFQSYTIGSANRWRKETQNLIDAAKSGNSKQIISALRRFGLLAGITGLALGEWTNLMRHAIRGHSAEDIAEDSAIAQGLKGEAWEATKNFFGNFADAAFLGPFMRIANNKTMHKELQHSPGSAVANYFWGTGLAVDVMLYIARGGKYANLSRFDATGKFFEDRIPGFKNYPDGFRRALSLGGLADVSDLDLGSAAFAYREWADDNLKGKNYMPAFGYAEDKAQTKKAYAKFKETINLADRAIKGNRDEAVFEILKKAFAAKKDIVSKDKDFKTPGKINREALKRVKAALNGYSFRIKNLDKEQQAALEAKIGEKRYHILETHDRLLEELVDSLSPYELE